MSKEEVNTRWPEKLSEYTAKGVRPDDAVGSTWAEYLYLGADQTESQQSCTRRSYKFSIDRTIHFQSGQSKRPLKYLKDILELP